MSGRLGAVDIPAATNTTLATGAASKINTVTVRFCNRGTDNAKIRLALLDGAIATIAPEDYIVYDFSIPPNGIFNDTGIVFGAGATLMVYSDVANVSAQAWGFEDIA